MLLQIYFTKFWEIHTEWDFVLLPVYLTIIVVSAYVIKNKHIKTNPEYKYFIPGLLFKIFGVLYFSYIYTFHYYGGDTTNYFQAADCMVNMMYQHFGLYLRLFFGEFNRVTFSAFDSTTGFPYYSSKPNSFAVARFSSPFVFLGFQSYYIASVLIAYATYTGVWKLFQIFVKEFPLYMNACAWAILFMPSVAFWGSGVTKDSFMLAALCWFVNGFYHFVKVDFSVKNLKYVFQMGISVWVMMSIKPFNFYAMLICICLWYAFEYIGRISNDVLRVLLYPFIFAIVSAAGMYVFVLLGSVAGGYYKDVDSMLNQAVVVQKDLSREAYGENSFDIGPFDPTLAGITKKIPAAIEAGLFRPFPWEANNVLMFISAAENVFLFFLTVFTLFSVGPAYFFKSIVSKPYIMMLSIVFSLFFAFSIGLVTANFGALVRYKIPLIPFYVVAFLVIYLTHRDRNRARREETVSL
jgi:hypothetical protein